MTQRAFRGVVGRLHVGVFQEGPEVITAVENLSAYADEFASQRERPFFKGFVDRPPERPVRELMNDSVVQYDEQVPAREIWNFLCRVAIRRVVVVNDGKPTGVISRASFLRWFHNRSGARREGVLC